jgi:hypothetical protein
MPRKHPRARRPQSPRYSTTVGDLARVLASGQDCAFALHDALLESGQAERVQSRPPLQLRGFTRSVRGVLP